MQDPGQVRVYKSEIKTSSHNSSSKQLVIIGSFLFKVFEVPIVLYDVAAGSNFMFWVNSRHNLEEPPDAPKLCAMPQ